ncbi:MAG: hypothetical protein GY811_13735 [Myxococcales bacterium]|nr:hypothetical protein [Myxococcales bacterium]
MAARVGINGLGRMGRLLLRAAWQAPEFDFVHVNEPGCTAEVAAHLLEFDSLHGRWGQDPSATDDAIHVDERALSYTRHDTPEAVPWADHGIDIVFECSGAFRTPESLAPYFAQGVKKVIVSAPVKDGALNVVVGINDHHRMAELGQAIAQGLK